MTSSVAIVLIVLSALAGGVIGFSVCAMLSVGRPVHVYHKPKETPE
jgi:presenilin-like A22 family membrane protease